MNGNFDSLCLPASKLFLKCQIGRAIDVIHIKLEKAEFYSIFIGYVSSYFGKSISVFTVNFCYKEPYTTRRHYYIPHGW